MKRNFIHAGAVVSLLSATACAPAVALADQRCDDPHGMIEKRACAKAAEGNDALRRFVSRTQGIWDLYYYDYARPDRSDGTAPVASAPQVPAVVQAGDVAVAARSR
ncbi:MAG: hypothetical protein KGL70_04705 [Betaproteobacteria bacterium]|nr:hypothetical protein [Betaproteobacteria bacterium]MDE2358665.1 hypothetical protein [Betaproteobacteria bacterium]